MRDDSLATFSQEFHSALSVVCNDLFFARYRQRQTTTNNTIATQPTQQQQEAEQIESAAKTLLESIDVEGAISEIEKEESVDQLLDMKLLKGTDGDGVHVTQEALQHR